MRNKNVDDLIRSTKSDAALAMNKSDSQTKASNIGDLNDSLKRAKGEQEGRTHFS